MGCYWLITRKNVAWHLYLGFLLASGPDKIAGAIKKIATKHNASIAQIALAWLLKRSENI